MKSSLFCILFWVFQRLNLLNVVSGSDFELVNTTSGVVRGVKHGNQGSHTFYKGIPYAEPPIEHRRFKPPEKLIRKRDEIDGSKYGSVCNQHPSVYGPKQSLQTSEDCLFLNVYTTKAYEKLPVMVFIHGGGLLEGSGLVYDSGVRRNFLINDVILVTINYRLGVFGFFNSNSSTFPANNGAMDQIMALQWVQDNIEKFGGDAKKVTIFGESSGATSVSLLTYSPLAKGLFHQIILESGSAHAGWALNHDEYGFEFNPSSNISQLLGCSTESSWETDSPKKIRDCLEHKTAEEIMEADEKLKAFDPFMGMNWLPYVDGPGGFLPDLPTNLNNDRSDINMLMGDNHDETCNYAEELEKAKQKFSSVLQGIVSEKEFGSAVSMVADLLTHNYKWANDFDEFDRISWINTTTSMYSDFDYGVAMQTEAEHAFKIMKRSKLYLYSFDYFTETYIWSKIWLGVCHMAEMPFIFANEMYGYDRGVFVKDVSFTNDDLRMATLMGKLWTNFAKSGNPNSPIPLSNDHEKWGAVSSPDRMEYYSINIESAMKRNYHTGAVNLWRIIRKLSKRLNEPKVIGSKSAQNLCNFSITFLLPIFMYLQ